MNLHPLFVHFPIAFLVLYSSAELVPSKTLRAHHSFFFIKLTLLVAGVFGAWLSLMSGDAIEHMFGNDAEKNRILAAHAFWASACTTAYAILAGVYIIEWIRGKTFLLPKMILPAWNVLLTLQSFLYRHWVRIVLAAFGFIAISLTGALGGALVHGIHVDPVVYWIYKLHEPFFNILPL